jgi:hypothetical protein
MSEQQIGVEDAYAPYYALSALHQALLRASGQELCWFRTVVFENSLVGSCLPLYGSSDLSASVCMRWLVDSASHASTGLRQSIMSCIYCRF